MKSKIGFTCNLIIPLFFQALFVFGSSSAAAATVVKTYSDDNSVFPNPERGFHNRYDLVPGGETDFSRSTNAGNTLVHSYVRLDDFRTSNISPAFLDKLTKSLGAARAQGKKVILRVAYNFGPYPDSLPDADEYWIGQHLAQLSPVLKANKDVIAFIEGGFIGAWGEWHTSTNKLDTDSSAKNRIINTMLQNVPESVQIAMRYPSDLRNAINAGVNPARLGSHQDCFLASAPDDWGTWGRDQAFSVEQDKAFIAQVGLNHPVGGETCNADSASRVSCPTALAEMQQMHFSEINEDFDTNAINIFKAQGCYNTIDQKLGYRFRLLDATYSNSIGVGSSVNLKVKLVNDGFASPFNARPLFAVLDGAGGSFSFQLAADPRNWKSGQQLEINESFTLPASIPKGVYRLSLWLPDNSTNLRPDARYSIRFANQGTWDAAKGLNVLATDVQVTDQTVTNPADSVFYEAESNVNMLSGSAIISTCISCSGQSKVGYLGNNSGALQFNNISVASAGSYNLTIFYTSAVARAAQVKINNGAASTINFTGTGDWSTLANASINVTLNSGTNTISFSNATGWSPDIDRIKLSKIDGPNTPTPTPAPTSLVINSFNDTSFLQNKNDLVGWTGANGFVNGGGALSNGALVLDYNNNGWFGSDISRDISSKKYLVFVIKGSTGGEGSGITVTLGGVTKTFAQLTSDGITTSYKTIRIDMIANGINRLSPGQLQMTFWGGSSGKVTIDEIRLE